MRRAAAIVPEAVPALLGQDAAGRRAGHGLSAGRAAIAVWKPELLAGRAEPAGGARGRRAPGQDPRRHGARPGDRRGLPDRPDLLTTSASSPIWRRPRAPIPTAPRRCTALVEATAADQSDPGAWRRQPEEHPGRARGSGVPRCRMRLVWRSGVRSGVLPQPPAAEVPVGARTRAADSFAASTRWPTAYLGGVAWEPPAALEARAAHLLPGLLLGRVDGKSPVEYLTAEADKDRVRRVARRLLTSRSSGSARSGRRGPRSLASTWRALP